MTIYRNGRCFELTSHELYEAWQEQEAEFSREDVQCELDYAFPDDTSETPQDIGVSRREAEGAIDVMVETYREFVDHDDWLAEQKWQCCRAAINQVLDNLRKGKTSEVSV